MIIRRIAAACSLVLLAVTDASAQTPVISEGLLSILSGTQCLADTSWSSADARRCIAAIRDYLNGTAPAAPSVSLAANPTSVTLGGSSTLAWSSTNATTCTASGATGWSGPRATSGSQTLTTLAATATYTLSCVGPSGTASQAATITVMVSPPPPPLPTASISAAPTTIETGTSAVLTWSSTNATECSVSGAWSGSKSTGGSQTVTPQATSTYTIQCSGAGGTSQPASAVVTVLPGGSPGLPPGVTLRDIDGGPDYFSKWSNRLPTSTTFFPIGVWFESVLSHDDVDKDQDAGLNTYMLLTANSDATLVESRGMHFFGQQSEWLSRESLSAIDGWELDDEVDMRFSPSQGFARLSSILAGLPNDGRPRYANYGKGVAFWLNNADAARYVNEFPDVVSVDTYWFSDENICGSSEGGRLVVSPPRTLTAAECHRAANYGLVVDRVRTLDELDGVRKPVWMFVEVGHPFSENHWPSITPVQVRAAVWHSLIAGARGIIYFNHSFGGACQTQHALRDPCYAAVREIVRTTNQQITQLAPILNAPFADGYVATPNGVRAMAKRGPDGAWYVFAGSRLAGSQTATFSIAAGATVEVLYENRTLSVTGGQFTDTFADGNAVHIYRIVD